MACSGGHCTGQCLCNVACVGHVPGCLSNWTGIGPVHFGDLIESAKLISIRTEINQQRSRLLYSQVSWNVINSNKTIEALDRNQERYALNSMGFVHGANESTGQTDYAQDVNDIIDSLNDARRACKCNTDCGAYSNCTCHNDCGCHYRYWLG